MTNRGSGIARSWNLRTLSNCYNFSRFISRRKNVSFQSFARQEERFWKEHFRTSGLALLELSFLQHATSSSVKFAAWTCLKASCHYNVCKVCKIRNARDTFPQILDAHNNFLRQQSCPNSMRDYLCIPSLRGQNAIKSLPKFALGLKRWHLNYWVWSEGGGKEGGVQW